MRTRICLYVLLILPLVVYWQTAFHEFGLETDYTTLHEANEDPGRLVREQGAEGRPLYGAMLETSFAVTSEVEHLAWLRFCTVMLLTLLGLVVWRQLFNSGWGEIDAAALGLGLAFLPSAQVLAGWAAGWPQAVTLLLAMAGFSAIETEIERGGMKRVIALIGGCMIYTAAALIYQVNVLFALTIVVAILFKRTGREPLSDLAWLSFHLAAVIVGLLFSYLIMHLLMSSGVFQAAEGTEGPGFLAFLRYPVPNALGLYALNDDHGHGIVWYLGAILMVAITLVLGFRRAMSSGDAGLRRRVMLAAGVLAVAILAICFFASEQIAAYRVIFPLAGLVLTLLIYAVRSLLVGVKIQLAHYLALGLVCAGVAFLAHRQSFLLLAEPQGVEWDEMRSAVLRANFERPVRVHIVLSSAAERLTDQMYGDEFGAISSDSDAVAKDMFRAALHARFPDRLPKGGKYTLSTSRDEPTTGTYDLLIDMRRIKRER